MHAPLGLVAQLRTDLPRRLAEGRAELENRVRVAHWVGEMTVQYGKRAIEQRLAPRSPLPVAADAVERAVIETRQFAKRQMTWFRHQMPDWTFIERSAPHEMLDVLMAELIKPA